MVWVCTAISLIIVIFGTLFLEKAFEKIFDAVFPEKPSPRAFVLLGISFVIVFSVVILANLLLQTQFFNSLNFRSQPTKNVSVKFQPTNTAYVLYQVITEEVSHAPECQFINEILEKERLIHWIDTPLGSEYWTGVQVYTETSLSLPAEWLMHIDSSNTDILGPTPVPMYKLVSIYAPYKCRPLAGPDN